jgi:hypothetical protein
MAVSFRWKNRNWHWRARIVAMFYKRISMVRNHPMISDGAVTMGQMAAAGIAMTFAALVGLLSVELIGTAQAGRDGDRAYLVAVSSGPALYLVRHGTSGFPNTQSRQLTCGRLLAVGEFRLGLQCQHHVRGGF